MASLRIAACCFAAGVLLVLPVDCPLPTVWADRHLARQAISAQTLPAATAVDAAARHVDRAQLMRDIETLAAPGFEGRATGSPGGIKARQWLVEQFDAIGLRPAGTQGYVHPFTVTIRTARALFPGGRAFRAEYAAGNVIGRLPAPEAGGRSFVITAHYDHLGIRDRSVYPGADDNASGVAALLAAARYFTRHPPRHPMVFAALDAEELGRRGARAFIQSGLLPPAAVALNVNLDMVSRSDANEIFAAGTYHSPWQRPILQEVQTRASVKILFGHDRPMRLAAGLEDWTQSSDHGPFHDAGVPFVYFGVEDHADYHRPTDGPHRIDPRFFGDVADMIVEALRTFDGRVE